MTEPLLRELAPAVIGVLLRRGADFVSAEDASYWEPNVWMCHTL